MRQVFKSKPFPNSTLPYAGLQTCNNTGLTFLIFCFHDFDPNECCMKKGDLNQQNLSHEPSAFLRAHHILPNNTGEVTNAKNIKANMPKILRPTHFLGMKYIKADSFSAVTNIKADMLKLNNIAKNMTNIKAELVDIKAKNNRIKYFPYK